MQNSNKLHNVTSKHIVHHCCLTCLLTLYLQHKTVTPVKQNIVKRVLPNAIYSYIFALYDIVHKHHDKYPIRIRHIPNKVSFQYCKFCICRSVIYTPLIKNLKLLYMNSQLEKEAVLICSFNPHSPQCSPNNRSHQNITGC